MPNYFEKGLPKLKFPIESGESPGLRAAQIAAAHSISGHFFSRKEPAIVVMPTGSGKTCVMLLAAFLLRAQRVLVLTPSRMVRDQIAEAFKTLAVLKRAEAIELSRKGPVVRRLFKRIRSAAGWDNFKNASVVVSTIHGASSADAVPPPDGFFDLVICDEAHHSSAPSWRKLLDSVPAARHLLFTATPFRRDSKVLRGKLIFEYPLARAREDGVFGQLDFQPVEPGAQPPDVAIAKAAARQFAADRKAGLRHLVMVRTSTRARAAELSKIYKSETRLNLATVLGSQSQNAVAVILDDLRAGRLDGVICVDMLGEGFDLPELKLAALHSPHRSLAITLQFIGRFARTTGSNTGVATFFAVPAEIDEEALPLYRPGAEWNELVESASRQRIDAEQEIREVLESFESPSELRSDEIDLSAIAPYFHVKVLDVPNGVDIHADLALPRGCETVFLRRSEKLQTVVCVTREQTKCRWMNDERLVDTTHDLFIIHYHEQTGFLFVCSSIRRISAYDELVKSVTGGFEFMRLSHDELNRVLRDIDDISFFSVGMRNRAGRGNDETYRTMSGPSADKVVQKSDGMTYERGHLIGHGVRAGAKVSIGISSGSKVWANRRGPLLGFLKWCDVVAENLRNEESVVTGSSVDFLPMAHSLDAFPPDIVAVEWNSWCFEQALTFEVPVSRGQSRSVPFEQCWLELSHISSREVKFSLGLGERQVACSARLSGSRLFDVEARGRGITVHDHQNSPVSIAEFLNAHPPEFFTSSLSRITGHEISGSPPSAEASFDAARIECVDWAAVDVDPLREKPVSGASKRSLFEWLQARLLAGPSQVIFNDDGAGEVADFISIDTDGQVTTVHLFHCKAAAGVPVPGNRVADLYEVVGQAAKCIRLTMPGTLREHLIRRLKSTKAAEARLVRGTAEQLQDLLGPGRAVRWAISIVQPGVGQSPESAMSTLLATADSYLRQMFGGLRVIGSQC